MQLQRITPGSGAFALEDVRPDVVQDYGNMSADVFSAMLQTHCNAVTIQNCAHAVLDHKPICELADLQFKAQTTSPFALQMRYTVSLNQSWPCGTGL